MADDPQKAARRAVADVLKARDTRPRLKTTTRCVQEVDYFDLDAFVKEITGRDWEFAAAEECGNYTDHSISVSAKPLDPYDQSKIDAFLAGDIIGRYPCARTMLDWLASQGHILPGNYLVRVSW